MNRDLHRENFLDKKRAKKNKDPNGNIVSHGKLEKGEGPMREVDRGWTSQQGPAYSLSGNT